MINKFGFSGVLGLFLLALLGSGCCQIPAKVPELVAASAESVDNQAALAAAQWDSALAAASAARKLLILVNEIVPPEPLDNMSDTQQKALARFHRGYPLVMHQLDAALAQGTAPQQTLARFQKISDAIRLANSYIAEALDENARLQAALDSLDKINAVITEVKDGSID